MGKKVLRLLGMVLILLCLSVTSVRAEEDSGSKEEAEDIIRQQMEALDFDSMDSIMGEVTELCISKLWRPPKPARQRGGGSNSWAMGSRNFESAV